MDVSIYHNPRCSKSRQALKLIEARGIKPRVIEYLKQPPSEAELKRILELLNIGPRDLLRTGEAAYTEAGLENKDLSEAQIIAAIRRHPILLQRPIVIAGDRAVIGRPPERVLEILAP